MHACTPDWILHTCTHMHMHTYIRTRGVIHNNTWCAYACMYTRSDSACFYTYTYAHIHKNMWCAYVGICISSDSIYVKIHARIRGVLT